MKLSIGSFGGGLLLPSLAASHAISPATRTCQDYFIPVNVTSEVLVPIYSQLKDNFDVMGLVNTLARWDVASFFVDFAISKGYSVFFYDRLGTGMSSTVSGYNEAQSTIQLAILQQLIVLLRSGKYTGSFGVPSKIVHVGHSFGSYLSNALVSTSPALSDAAILTGMGYNYSSSTDAFVESWGLRIGSQQAPGKWPGRDKHYLTWGDIFGNVAVFFYGSSYNKKALEYTESAKQPIAAIELLTLTVVPTVSPDFAKPVLVISGEFDFAVCGGNCVGKLDQSMIQKDYFPNATDFQAHVHPGTGHGINFSYNATGAYGVITDYLSKHGL